MARIFASGAEFQTGVVSPPTPEGWAASGAGTVSIVTSGQRSGNAAYQAAITAQNWTKLTPNYVASTTFFHRMYFNFSALPTGNNCYIFALFNGSTEVGSVQMSTGGTLALTLNAATLTSLAGLSTGTWYMLEVEYAIPSSGASTLTMRVNGTTVGSGNGSATIATEVRFGATVGHSTPTGGGPLTWDDIAMNDATGTVNNSWCGEGSVRVLLPVADASRTGWTAGAGGTTNLWDALNNLPPVGLAPGSETNSSQIKDLLNNTTDTYQATCAAYTAALSAGGGGLSGHEQIVYARVVGQFGSHGGRAAENLGVSGISNPAITEVTRASITTTVSTWPTNWAILLGNVIEWPVIEMGTGPVIQVRKNTANTNGVELCLLALVFEASPPYNINQQQVFNQTQADNRAALM